MSYLSEMEKNSEIQLSIKTKKGNLKFNSVVLEPLAEAKRFGYGLKIKPIRVNGMLVNMQGYNIKATVYQTSDNRSYKFPLSLALNSKEDNTLHIYSHANSKPVNRRGAFRLPCNYEAQVITENSVDMITGYVHDISLSGISITFSNNTRCPFVGSQIRFVLIDSNGLRFKMSGEVVQVNDEFDDDRFLVGIRFSKTTKDVSDIVASLQLKELKVRRGSP